MARFEYSIVTWSADVDAGATETQLNALGAEGWEAVSMVTRGTTTPVPGMGAKPVPEIVVLLKRPLGP